VVGVEEAAGTVARAIFEGFKSCVKERRVSQFLRGIRELLGNVIISEYLSKTLIVHNIEEDRLGGGVVVDILYLDSGVSIKAYVGLDLKNTPKLHVMLEANSSLAKITVNKTYTESQLKEKYGSAVEAVEKILWSGKYSI